MKFPNIKEIAPSESGYPVKDYSLHYGVSSSQYLIKNIDIDLLLKNAEKNRVNYDEDGNRIAFDADGFA